MAEIEKEDVCYLIVQGVTLGGSTSFIYIIQLYTEDCTILLICWDVAVPVLRANSVVFEKI